jgi:hypothetical protein
VTEREHESFALAECTLSDSYPPGAIEAMIDVMATP